MNVELVLFPSFILIVLATTSAINLFSNSKKVRKVTSFAILGEILIALAIATYFLYPRNYDKVYLKEARQSQYKTEPGLARVANDNNLFIGSGVNNEMIKAHPKLIAREFNSITPLDALHWGSLLENGKMGNYSFSSADSVISFGMENNLRIRGHVLIWGRYPGVGFPKELKKILNTSENKKEKTIQFMDHHITTVLSHYKEKIKTWDVVNEPLKVLKPEFDGNLFYENLGKNYIFHAFHKAHETDSTLQLFLNEQFMNYHDERADFFLDLIAEMVEKKTPIHGIGIQSHVLFNIPEIEKLSEFIQKIEALGLKVEITELDTRLKLFEDFPNPYQSQGDFFGEIAGLTDIHKNLTGITCWGLSDKYSWINNVYPFTFIKPNEPLIFDSEMAPKPAYFELKDVIKSN
ncbi:MAG: endo-1,4-beta-xylanase [Flammeovirgaceae bacterium]|nr:endo-1,4-beta-xylanase [Flammeovirgaceae bacterium]